jgi:hypothetical protein
MGSSCSVVVCKHKPAAKKMPAKGGHLYQSPALITGMSDYLAICVASDLFSALAAFFAMLASAMAIGAEAGAANGASAKEPERTGRQSR